MELVRAKVTKNGRLLESISTMFGESVSKKRNNVSIQRWDVTRICPVYVERAFATGEILAPGTSGGRGLDMFVWQFGVDEPGEAVKK